MDVHASSDTLDMLSDQHFLEQILWQQMHIMAHSKNKWITKEIKHHGNNK